MKPRVLLALLTVLSMCFLQVRSSLIVTTSTCYCLLPPIYGHEYGSLSSRSVFLGADSDDCAIVRVKFYLPGFFPSLQS